MDGTPVLCQADETEPTSVQPRRFAVVRVGYRDVLAWVFTRATRLPQFVMVLKGPGIPPDAKVLAVREDFCTRSFEVMLEHPSFEEVPDGMPAPNLTGKFGFEWEAVPTTNPGE